jgi:hypothetical protein
VDSWEFAARFSLATPTKYRDLDYKVTVDPSDFILVTYELSAETATTNS